MVYGDEQGTQLLIIDTHEQLWTAEAIMAMPEAMRENYVKVFAGNLPTIADVWSYMKGPVKDKALFGSDFQLVSRNRVVDELSDIGLPGDTCEAICYRNALEVIPGLKEEFSL